MDKNRIKRVLAIWILVVAACIGISFVGFFVFHAWKEILITIVSIAIVWGVPLSILWAVDFVREDLKGSR